MSHRGKNDRKKIEIAADDVTNENNVFEKLCEKWLKYVFLLKLTLWQLEKRSSKSFLAFESQNNIQFRCIYTNVNVSKKSYKKVLK